MLSRELFEKLEIIARALKKNTKHFGGIQLILAGDFCQLKPVTTVETTDEENYCFASPTWDICVDFSVFLTENYRHSEQELQHVVNDIRPINLSKFSKDFIRQSLTRPLTCDPFEIVRLYPHRESVSEANDMYLMLPIAALFL